MKTARVSIFTYFAFELFGILEQIKNYFFCLGLGVPGLEAAEMLHHAKWAAIKVGICNSIFIAFPPLVVFFLSRIFWSPLITPCGPQVMDFVGREELVQRGMDAITSPAAPVAETNFRCSMTNYTIEV